MSDVSSGCDRVVTIEQQSIMARTRGRPATSHQSTGPCAFVGRGIVSPDMVGSKGPRRNTVQSSEERARTDLEGDDGGSLAPVPDESVEDTSTRWSRWRDRRKRKRQSSVLPPDADRSADATEADLPEGSHDTLREHPDSVLPPDDAAARDTRIDPAQGIEGGEKARSQGANTWPLAIADPGAAAAVESSRFRLPHGRPDTAIDFATLGDFVIRAASVRGRYKRSMSRPREDDFAIRSAHHRTGELSYLIVAVCDGVGGANRGDIGATIASAAICDELYWRLTQEGKAPGEIPWSNVFDAVSRQLVGAASRSLAGGAGVSVVQARKEIATTAIAAVLMTEGDDAGRYWGARIGDANAFRIVPDTGITVIFPPIEVEDDQLKSSKTKALPIAQAESRFQPFGGRVPVGGALGLVTDGVADPLDDGQTLLGDALCLQWQSPPSPYSFATTVDFASRGYDDDRTAVVIWRSRKDRFAETSDSESVSASQGGG